MNKGLLRLGVLAGAISFVGVWAIAIPEILGAREIDYGWIGVYVAVSGALFFVPILSLRIIYWVISGFIDFESKEKSKKVSAAVTAIIWLLIVAIGTSCYFYYSA